MHDGRWRYWGPLGVVLVAAFAVRLWGIKQGLPYVYDVDEYGHFVPEAVAMFHHGLNPHYFVNPPALTYLLHIVFAVWFGVIRSGSHESITHQFVLHPDRFFLVARVSVALLGTVAVWLLYLVGGRLFSRGVGLLASVVMAVAFLPVFYGHLALNDAPTLVPLTLSLLGTAGVLRGGRMFDYLLAGAGVGLAAATKYTAGVMILPLLIAAAVQYRDAQEDGRRAVAIGVAVALIAALCSYLISNPYSVLDFHSFRKELELQSSYTERSHASWIGGPKQGGFSYYLWSFTWGLGWIPALAALGGAVSLWRAQRRVGLVLVSVTVLYVLFLSVQGRYFGRWLLPVFPIACLLAASFALGLARSAARRAPRLPGAAAAFTALAVLALGAQGLFESVHSGVLLSRPDTRNLARTWALQNIPAGARIVLEPVVPNAWLDETSGSSGELPHARARWMKYPALRVVLNPASGAPERAHRTVALEGYESTLGPALIGYYERHRYCWVLSGTSQSGRAFADPEIVPHAIDYYRALKEQGEVVYHVSPYSPQAHPVEFNFDWTFDYYPRAFRRPGPEMTVYRLHGGACAGLSVQAGRRGAPY